jgi:hypothetical protein
MKSPLLHKLGLLPRQVPRAKRRLTADPGEYARNPPVFVNSFPKSGTHLLLQILEAIPRKTHYGSFIATTPTLTFRQRSPRSHRRLIERIAPGELIPGHLYYRPEHHALLVAKRCTHYFIYRDPRDVVVSEAHYLTYMNRWHRLHRYFKGLANDRERITFSILGSSYRKVPYDYPDIAERFGWYRGWLEQPDVCCLTFEELVPARRRETTRRLVQFYLDRVGSSDPPDGVVDRALAAVDSTASKTFRKGQVGGWVDEFTDEHRDQMRRVAGQMLVDLGYESSLEW